jgi:hypothetical protein
MYFTWGYDDFGEGRDPSSREKRRNGRLSVAKGFK